MRQLLSTLCLGTIVASARLASAAPSDPAPLIGPSVHQLLLVRAATWSSTSATLQRYEREDAGGWRTVGRLVPVSLGRHGLAWGRGLQPSDGPGPTKHEGDGRSPAGIFKLGTAFGAASEMPSGAHPYPYRRAMASSYCVEDVHSPHYNELVDATAVERPRWQRWSPLRRSDGLFRWGVVVVQNMPDVVVGAGSCVFLHVWRGQRQPTSGCTAMPFEAIEEILRWLDLDAQPTLVQLPEPIYASVAAHWSLPDDGSPSPAGP